MDEEQTVNDAGAQMAAILGRVQTDVEATRRTGPVLAATGTGDTGRVIGIGAMAVQKRLQELTKQAAELVKQAELVASALAGPSDNEFKNRANPVKTEPHLFGKQMLALDELGLMLDSVHRAIERAARSLT